MGRGLSRIVAVAANTFRETVRERVLYNLVFFAILMTLAGLLLGPLSIRQDEKILKDVGLAAMDGFGTLIAVFIGTGLVSKEIERRSLYPLLAKPLSRGEFFLGKFAGLAFTLLVNVSVMLSGLLLNVALYAVIRCKVLVDGAVKTALAGNLLMGFGLLSAVLAAFFLWRQKDIKRLREKIRDEMEALQERIEDYIRVDWNG